MNFLKPYINITFEKTLPRNLPLPPNNKKSKVFREENSTELNRLDVCDAMTLTYDNSSCSIIGINADTTNTISQN